MKYSLITYMSEYQRQRHYDKFTMAFEEFWPANVQLKVFDEKSITEYSDYLAVSSKMLSIYHANKLFSSDWIIYIEPNMITKKEITQEFLNENCDNDYFNCYYGDPRNEEFQMSTHWLAFNRNHGLSHHFFNCLGFVYKENKFSSTLEYSDGYLLNSVRDMVSAIGYVKKYTNIINHTHIRNLWANSKMGEYFDKI